LVNVLSGDRQGDYKMESTETLTVPGNFALLCSSVENRIQEIKKDRRLQGPINPKCDISSLTYDGMNFSKKYLDLITLIILCWYGDVFQGFESYILYEIRTYLEKNLLFPELAAACSAKEISLLIIVSFSKRYSDRKLFGTILQPERVERVVNQARLRLVQSHRAKRKIRHRGYRDHGTLRPPDQWTESSDWSFTEAQNLKEQKRIEYTDFVDLYVHSAGDWLLKNSLKFEK
jgi:hypothetical protein